MKIKLACLGLGALLAAAGAAQAGDFSYGAGLRNRVEVPAPIPVPAPMPVPEGFTYYLRADLGWSFASEPSFSESGATHSALAVTFASLPSSVSTDGVLGGTIGFGAYLTPHLRGDLTLDFRAEQDVDATATYTDPPAVAGVVTERLKVSRVVGLVNAYWDVLPRGAFTPYIGAGIGFVYNDIERTHITTEDAVQTRTGSGQKANVGLAAALMAGASFSFSHSSAIDVNYRALFLDGGSVTATLTGPAETSKATLGDVWEHQVRVGLRFNIW